MSDVTAEYLRANDQQTKNIALVVCIDGLPFCFSNRSVYSKVKYGDPGLVYGLPGLVYGALRKVDSVYDILSLEASSLTISQAIEPEQGRASISSLNLAFIDLNELMTQVVSPGVYLDEILGKSVTVELGYQDVSYPQDYQTIFRGYVSSVRDTPGLVYLGLSDPNLKRRANLFYSPTTKLTAGINAVATTIPVVKTADFYQEILGPSGVQDPAIRTFIKIDDEFIEYPTSGITPTSFTGVTRGARGTVAAIHDPDSDVSCAVEIEDTAIDMALKLMLSGWNGPCITGKPIQSIVTTLGPLGNLPNSITLPLDQDADRLYGLTVGDYVSISGSAVPANNVTNRKVLQILDFSTVQPNRVIVVDGAALSPENSTTGTLSIRSKYDTYPVNCGSKLPTADVDVTQHETIKAQFLGGAENSYRFLLDSEQSGKTFIEKEIYLPLGCYSLTRQGRLSVNLTKPPIGSVPLVELNADNILQPNNLRPERAVNSRTFFNDILFVFDYDDEGQAKTKVRFLDTDSLNIIGLLSTLRIESKGLRSDLAADISQVVNRRAKFLLTRYKRGATTIYAEVNWGVGNLIEAGDVVTLNGANLSIANFIDGTRNFSIQLFEVVDRKLNIGSGNVALKLISGVGAEATDRFASISPSSVIVAGSTTIRIPVTESFTASNPAFPGAEYDKWDTLIGQVIAIHDEAFTFYEETTLIGQEQSNQNILIVDPPLSIAPPAGYIVDISRYPTSTDPNVGAALKALFGHVNDTISVVAGVSVTEFTVAPGDIGRFFVGAFLRVHNATFTLDANDIIVSQIVGNNVQVSASMGFVPAAGYLVDLIGYPDQGGAYRWL